MPTGRSGGGEQRREVALDVRHVCRCGGAFGGELGQGMQAVGSPALGDMGGGVAGEGRWRERPEGVEDLPNRRYYFVSLYIWYYTHTHTYSGGCRVHPRVNYKN